MEYLTLQENDPRCAVCDTCTGILAKWTGLMWRASESFTGQSGVHESVFRSDFNWGIWTWKGRELRSSACRFCCFVKKSLEVSVCRQYQDDDYIVLESNYVGYADVVPEGEAEQDETASSCHRPSVKLYRKTKTGLYDRYYYTYILPLALSSMDWEDTRQTKVFHGRAVAPETNFELVQHWLDTCRTKHVDGPKAHMLEDCNPTTRRPISYSRLVDVKSRCVVVLDPSQEYVYAALSYVWGGANRLLLTSETLEALSIPNALSPDNKHVPATFRDTLTVADLLNIPYVFIDAICILQDSAEQLAEHMNSMDSIYSSATLTIVSDTDSAENGIPGISSPRTLHQAAFHYRGKDFISATESLDSALASSYWESRAWCLQEKVFSKRLLIFTPIQTFFRCKRAKKFEDTILQAAENATINDYNFWYLVQTYTRRQLSFDSDIIRAFSGILRFVEPTCGAHVFGVPPALLGPGLAWCLSAHKMSLRRPEYPSWSWAGWNGSTVGNETEFKIEFKNPVPHNLMSGSWAMEWHFYQVDGNGHVYEMKAQDSSKNISRVRYVGQASQVIVDSNSTIRAHGKERRSQPRRTSRLLSPSIGIPAHQNSPEIPHPSSSLSAQQPACAGHRCSDFDYPDCERCGSWLIPGHPGGSNYIRREIPPLIHDPRTMPPLLHILRFYTSSAHLFIDTQPAEIEGLSDVWEDVHSIRIPATGKVIGTVCLDPQWAGRGKEAEFVFIGVDSFSEGVKNKTLILMLVEPVGESGIVKKVTLCTHTKLYDWREARPVWKLVNLA